MQNIIEYFQNKESELIEKIRQIVEIESPTHDEEGNHQVVDFLKVFPETSEMSGISKGFIGKDMVNT